MPFLNLPCKEIKAQYSRDNYIDFAKLAPSLKLIAVFSTFNKLYILCYLKCSLPILKQSKATYKVNCSECDEHWQNSKEVK